jgi:hypothetical protein
MFIEVTKKASNEKVILPTNRIYSVRLEQGDCVLKLLPIANFTASDCQYAEQYLIKLVVNETYEELKTKLGAK